MSILQIVLAGYMLFSLQEEAGWTLRKNNAGIVVYTRSVDGSAFKEFKGVVSLNATSLMKVLDIILDIEKYGTLIPDCKDAEILLQKGKYYDIHYLVIEAPWPMNDRDAIYEMNTTFTNNMKHAIVSLKPIPGYIGEKENLVRMKNGTGFWEIEEAEENTVNVTYQFHAEPGGDIPAWLSNNFVVSNPFQTLSNLKKKVGEK